MGERFVHAAVALVFLVTAPGAFAAEKGLAPEAVEENPEPIRYFERHKPTFFLIGKPNTKAQFSLKVQLVRDVPLQLAYTQLIIWDLFKASRPIRDINYNPELFYRWNLKQSRSGARDLDIIYEHESNGRAHAASRGWNRTGLRYIHSLKDSEHRLWWSMKAWITSGSEIEVDDIRRRRGNWELEIGGSNLFNRFFEVNEVVLRIYGGGRSRVNPLQGGQELTYREKTSSRKILLPLYFQVFHGYGENLLDAAERRWAFRAGLGF